jgi:hypothetical protein
MMFFMIVLLSKCYLGDTNRIRLARAVVCKVENCLQGRKGKPEATEQYEDLGVDGNIILKLILNTRDGKVWFAYIWLRYGQVVGFCKDDSESSGSITCEDCLD